jgi:hypothetical protein
LFEERPNRDVVQVGRNAKTALSGERGCGAYTGFGLERQRFVESDVSGTALGRRPRRVLGERWTATMVRRGAAPAGSGGEQRFATSAAAPATHQRQNFRSD